MTTLQEKIDEVCTYHANEMVDNIPGTISVEKAAEIYELCEHLINHGIGLGLQGGIRYLFDTYQHKTNSMTVEEEPIESGKWERNAGLYDAAEMLNVKLVEGKYPTM